MERSFILLKIIAGIGLLSLLLAFTDPDFTGRLLILWVLLRVVINIQSNCGALDTSVTELP
jgi:hypothetical protein